MTMKKELELIEERQVERLKILGEMCVKYARTIPEDIGFEDPNGDLRSSIGCKVFRNGVSVYSNYKVVGDGYEGARMGAELAEKVGRGNKSGVMIVVTFGLDYVYHVEHKGVDTSSSTEQMMNEDLPTLMFILLSNIEFSSKMMTDK